MRLRLNRDGHGTILVVGAYGIVLTGPGRHTPAEIGHRLAEEAVAGLARHLPRRLRRAVVIDAGVHAIRGDEEVPAVPFLTVLERMPR